MKTKKQIKQGCGKKVLCERKVDDYTCGKDRLCQTCQALLKQIEGFNELINDYINNHNMTLVKVRFNELKARINGDDEEVLQPESKIAKFIDNDFDTCYKHNIYCPGSCCPECKKEKGCGKEYIGTKETCGIDDCIHNCGDGTWLCPECKKEKGCGKYVGNWRCGTIFHEEGKEDKMFLCFECEKARGERE